MRSLSSMPMMKSLFGFAPHAQLLHEASCFDEVERALLREVQTAGPRLRRKTFVGCALVAPRCAFHQNLT
jgi:hypothetical protein